MVVAEVGATWQDMGCGRGGLCVNFDSIFFFVGHLLDLEFAIGLIRFWDGFFVWVHGGGVGGCHGGGERGWGFLLWVICGFMVVMVGGLPW